MPILRITAAVAFLGCSGVIVGPRGEGDTPNVPPGTPSTPPGMQPPTGGPPAAPPTGPCRVSLPLRRLTDVQYRNAVRDLFQGMVTASARFPASEPGAARSGFSTEPAANQVTLLGAENLLDAAEEVAAAVADKLPAFLPCAATAPGEACAATFLDRIGPRAFRRPLAPEERTLYLSVHRRAAGADAFKDGIALMVSALLQAPQFLYLVETGAAPSSRTRCWPSPAISPAW